MDNEYGTRYTEQPNVDRLDGHEGVAEEENIFALNMPDEDITQELNRKINDSRTFWNDESGFNLSNRRRRNARFLIGDHWHNIPLFQYHVPYVQNEIWTAEHVTSAIVTSRLPELEVYPAQDTPESRALAQDLAALMKWHGEEHNLQEILCNIVLSLLNNYVGLIELEWDEDCGPNGDVVPNYLDPADVIIDKRAKLGKNPSFICVTKQATSDELIAQFPQKKKDVLGRLGDKKQGIITYRKVYCTYYNDQDKPEEGVVYYFENIVLGKHKTPDWIYDEGKEGVKNYLPYPMKPVIPFNYVNDGSHWIDRASPIDQAIPLQLMVNRIGKQIQEGVAHASPVLVFNKRALSKPNADMITGQPWEKILVDSENVKDAYGVIQANNVPNMVINEIERLGAKIHELFGTPPQLRGDEGGNKTLGQDVMARDQAQGRQDLLVRAIDRGLDKYYKYLLQMIKVYYTEAHYASVLGEDGRYDFIMINREKLEDGMKVTVKAGSTLPLNKLRMQDIGLRLAEINKISSLSLYEFLDIPNPAKHVERLMKELVDPVAVVEDLKSDEQDKNAVQDFILIKNDEVAPPRDDVDIRHISTHQRQLVSNEFIEEFTPEQQMALRDHIQTELDKMKLLHGISDEELYAEDQGTVSPEAGAAGAPVPPETGQPAQPMV